MEVPPALVELNQLIHTAANNHEFRSGGAISAAAQTPEISIYGTPQSFQLETERVETQTLEISQESEGEPATPQPEEVSIYGINLLLDDERSKLILLKFLKAKDFNVIQAFNMIKRTVLWREEFQIEALLEEDLGGNDLEKVVFMHGLSREGHPVCYNVYGEFQKNRELYESTFSDQEKRLRFIRWRIQLLEKTIRTLDFSQGGISTIVQVTDLENYPALGKREIKATNEMLLLLQDNYPEFVAKHVFINVPCWYFTFHQMISPFWTQRSKSKYVFAVPSQTAKTLFKYIIPEQVPVQYGGFSKEGEQAFSCANLVTEITMKPGTVDTRESIEVPIAEACVFLWEIKVVGWEVNVGVEFVPIAEDGFTVIVYKARRIKSSDTHVIGNSFRIGEPGRIVITFVNSTRKKKKILYRFKTQPS